MNYLPKVSIKKRMNWHQNIGILAKDQSVDQELDSTNAVTGRAAADGGGGPRARPTVLPGAVPGCGVALRRGRPAGGRAHGGRRLVARLAPARRRRPPAGGRADTPPSPQGVLRAAGQRQLARGHAAVDRRGAAAQREALHDQRRVASGRR